MYNQPTDTPAQEHQTPPPPKKNPKKKISKNDTACLIST